MKTILLVAILSVVMTCVFSASTGEILADGSDPSPGTSIFELEVLSTNLNPNSFEITFGLSVVPGRIFALAAYDGPPDSNTPYSLVSSCFVPSSNVLEITDSGGSLPTNGRTYRGVVPAIGCTLDGTPIFTLSEVFIAYLFFAEPSVAISPDPTSTGQFRISYAEGIYSNAQTVTASTDVIFYRVSAELGDPSNAVIQSVADSELFNW